MGFGNFFKKAMPWISAAASCNVPALVGLAANSVSNAVGKNVPAEPDAIAAAIAGATPEQIEALKQHDADLAVKIKSLGFEHEEELETIAAEDRANARDREEKVRDTTPRNLAYIYAAGFFLTLAAEIWMAVRVPNVNQLVMKSIDILLGAELGMVLGSKEYYFGSSAGSDRKNGIIERLSS
jgi:hypothetical protein